MKKTCATCRWRSDAFTSVCVNAESDHRADYVDADCTCPHWSPTLAEDPADGKYTGLTEEE